MLRTLTHPNSPTNLQLHLCAHQMFHMEQREAAEALDLKLTVFKAIQKQLNIPRWPYRLINSMEAMANTIRQDWEDDEVKRRGLWRGFRVGMENE
jgi:hypothetical protein